MGSRGLVRSNALAGSPQKVEFKLEGDGGESEGPQVDEPVENTAGNSRHYVRSDVASAKRPNCSSTSDQRLETRDVTLPEWVSVMEISGTQYTILVSVSVEGNAMEPSTSIIMTDFKSAWGGFVPCADEEQWENSGRALKGLKNTQDPPHAPYIITFAPSSGDLSVSWKSEKEGAKGKGRTTVEEVVRMHLDEQPNKAELVKRIFEVAMKKRDERQALSSARSVECETATRESDEAIRTLRSEGEKMQGEKKRMLEQIGLLMATKKARVDDLTEAGGPPSASRGGAGAEGVHEEDGEADSQERSMDAED